MSQSDKSHEMLVLWMDINRALLVEKKCSETNILELDPWTCNSESAQRAWRRITARSNLDALEEWLEVAESEQMRRWTLKAIEICKGRKQD